jgi:hypothetical protein
VSITANTADKKHRERERERERVCCFAVVFGSFLFKENHWKFFFRARGFAYNVCRCAETEVVVTSRRGVVGLAAAGEERKARESNRNEAR